MLDGKKVADAIAALTTTCTVGATCSEVQNNPVCAAVHADLQAKVATANEHLSTMQKAEQEARAAGTQLLTSYALMRAALATYETAVNGIAKGDASVINKAGCEARPEVPSAATTVEKVEKVTYTLGKNAKQSVLHWSETVGAKMYAVEVNYNPQAPNAEWTSLGTTTRRSKVVTVASPASQFLVRIGALDSYGNAADWSDMILATAR